MNSAVAEVNGQSIHYTDTGGDLPVVAFSHGFLMSGAMFAPQIEALRDRYRCIAWDERGHGGTPPGNAEFSYYDSADDLYALLTSLGVARAVLVGMSQGGFLSQRFALTHPELVAGLVLLSTEAAADPPEKRSGYEALIGSWQANGLDSVSQVVAGIILDLRSPVTPLWIERWRAIDPVDLDLPFRTLVERDDVTPRLGEIATPTLVVWGELDAAITERHAVELAEGIAGSEFVRIPDAGHAVNLTHPHLVTPHLERFLAGVFSAG